MELSTIKVLEIENLVERVSFKQNEKVIVLIESTRLYKNITIVYNIILQAGIISYNFILYIL